MLEIGHDPICRVLRSFDPSRFPEIFDDAHEIIMELCYLAENTMACADTLSTAETRSEKYQGKLEYLRTEPAPSFFILSSSLVSYSVSSRPSSTVLKNARLEKHFSDSSLGIDITLRFISKEYDHLFHLNLEKET